MPGSTHDDVVETGHDGEHAMAGWTGAGAGRGPAGSAGRARVRGPVVGLDIGSAAVRAVELRAGRRGRPAVVRRSGRVDLPPGAVEAGAVRQQPVVAAALRQLWAEQGFSTKVVRLGVGSGSVLVRQLELDWMPEEDLRRSLRFQVSDLLPVPVDDANLDHVPLGERVAVDDQGHDRRLSRILLVATAREAVDGLVRCAQAAGLRPVGADLAAFATIRSVLGATPPVTAPAATLAEAVVDVGAETVTVAVHVGGRPRFVRVVPGVGGAMLTRSLVEQTGCSWVDAEARKRTADALPPAGAAPLTREQAVLLEAAMRLLTEVRATLDFHTSAEPAAAPAAMVLAGQGSLVPGLAEHAAHALGLPVRALAAPGGGTDLAVPYGLCLAGAA